MEKPVAWLCGAAVGLIGSSIGVATQDRTDVFVASRDHPAIGYSIESVSDPVEDLNRAIRNGTIQLWFESATGYLRSTLQALQIPIESQTLVFSETSSQSTLVNPQNPRALYFNDRASVGWVRGGDSLTVSAQDPRQGTIFYTLKQVPSDRPQLTRDDRCLLCHQTWDTLGVPGPIIFSTLPMLDTPYTYATGGPTDHRTPLNQRWGGWYVTGRVRSGRHLGNTPVLIKNGDERSHEPPGITPELASVEDRFDARGYLTHFSDVTALMVLEHQARMTNLLTRLNWEARVASYETLHAPVPSRPVSPGDRASRVTIAVDDLVDYLLFVDEAPLPGRIEGTSGFAERFAAAGPYDAKGRSLRQFDLEHRLMRYPCSYMIYSPMFDALPATAKTAVYRRMWDILAGHDLNSSYARLSLTGRRAIIEILRDTKKDLPPYFEALAP